jgi:predicted outer membrane protein
MSGRGRGGAGRGRPRKQQEPEAEPELDVSPAAIEAEAKQKRVPKPKAHDPNAFLRQVDIARSRIAVIIDSLEGDDNEAVLKRNVTTALKHLKAVYEMLEHP